MVSYVDGRPSVKLQRLQQVQQDLAHAFVDYCHQRSLQPFLAAGSALGAWRDGAMIAWDDDIDFGMLRDDYDDFVAAFSTDPMPGVHLQNCHTVPGYPFAFSKLRIDGTVLIEKPALGPDFHQGIFIDIFPYDAEVRSALFRPIHQLLLLTINLFVLSPNREFAMGARTQLFRGARLVAAKLRPFLPIRSMISMREWLCRLPLTAASDTFICYSMYGILSSARTRMPRVGLVPPVTAQFGNHKMPVPADSDTYLRQIFGDYRRPPPTHQQQPSHINDVDFGTAGEPGAA